jgi:hypothetical protein
MWANHTKCPLMTLEVHSAVLKMRRWNHRLFRPKRQLVAKQSAFKFLLS